MTTGATIRTELAKVLAREKTLNAFNEWLTLNYWSAPRTDIDTQARALAGAIELALAEYSDHKLTLAKLYENLLFLIANPETTLSFGATNPVIASSNSSVVSSRLFLSAA